MKDTHAKIMVIIVILVILSTAAYIQVAGHGFINFDDALYITDNPHVNEGITTAGVSWAFGFTDRTYWHPITWLSHMIDCEMFGLDAGMHHIMNLFYHVLNSIVLFLVLHLMTGTLWRSAFVSALFAVHPVNVDTVAWITQRKNLLSTLFCLLTLLSYTWYTHRKTIFRYLTAFGLFVLGILSKPMIVTLPFALLLLDYWPMNRIRLNFGSFSGEKAQCGLLPQDQRLVALKLVLEKIPFLLIAILMIYVSMNSVHGHMHVITTDMVSVKLRLENALVSYVLYLGKLICPWNLTIYYPYPESIPFTHVILAGIAITAVTAFSVIQSQKRPYLVVGWLWYLGTLVPVSGIIQAGLWPAMAERWAYVPFIGLFVIVSWGSYDLYSRVHQGKIVFAVSSVVVVTILALFAWKQAGYWENDFKLFSHAIQVNGKNSIAYSNLADVFLKEGDLDKALLNYSKSVSLNPNDLTTRNNYAIALLNAGQFSESIRHFQALLQRTSDDEQSYIGLGIALARQGDYSAAINSLSGALRINPGNAETHFQIAVLLGETGKIDEAILHYKRALSINSEYADARNNLRIITDHKNRIDQAIEVLQEQLESNTDNPVILQKLAALYSQKADYNNALDYLERVIRIQPDNADGYYNMACVYARQGDVQRSIQWLEKAFEKGFSNLELLKTDKDLYNIRDSEYFKNLVKDKALGTGQ